MKKILISILIGLGLVVGLFFYIESPSYLGRVERVGVSQTEESQFAFFNPLTYWDKMTDSEIKPVKYEPLKETPLPVRILEDIVQVPVAKDYGVWGGAGIGFEKKEPNDGSRPEMNQYKVGIYQDASSKDAPHSKVPIGYGLEMSREKRQPGPRLEENNDSLKFKLFWDFD